MPWGTRLGDPSQAGPAPADEWHLHERGRSNEDDGAARSSAQIAGIEAWWRAANYLSAGQIYLLDGPLLRMPPRSSMLNRDD
jgi:hypothetical protein